MTEPFLVEMAIDFLPPIGRKLLSFTTSRLLVLPDRTTRSVLELLAERKFGGRIPKGYFPFWIDGNPENETLENVDVALTPPIKRLKRVFREVPWRTA